MDIINVLVNYYSMKEKSTFSSKKISTRKVRKTNLKTKKSISWIKKTKSMDVFENQEIKKDLQSFYNKEAKKYAETRKKFRHEEKAILDAITPLFSQSFWTEWNEVKNLRWYTQDSSTNISEWQTKKIRILEFGCGSGRFASLLNQNFADKFDYVWIDLSDELLSYASKDNPNLTFFQWDITQIIKNFEQESFDFIVWTSSFQHIPTDKERSFLMKNFYRLLDYDGILLITNRSLSDWFVKKNWKIVMKARLKSWLKLRNDKARDLMVPRTDSDWKVYERFYHFFSLKELEKLARFSWLTIQTNTYLNDNWEFTENEKISRSSFFVASKTPIES